MSDYSKSYDGAAKDAAASTITGADFDTEFTAIQTAVATKANKTTPSVTNNLAMLASTGDLADSGILYSNVAQSARGALVYHNTTQSVNGGYLSFNSEVYDTETIHDVSTNNSRLTVPSGVSKVRVSANIAAASTISDGELTIGIHKNRALFTGFPVNSTSITSGGTSYVNICSPVLSVIPGDYFEIIASETSSGSVTTSAATDVTWFAMEVIK